MELFATLKSFNSAPYNIHFISKNVFDEMSIFIDSRLHGLNPKDGCADISKIPNSYSIYLEKNGSSYYQYYIVNGACNYFVEISFYLNTSLYELESLEIEITITCVYDDDENLRAKFKYESSELELCGWLYSQSDNFESYLENQEEKLNQILKDAFLEQYFATFKESEFSLENIGTCTKIFD